VVLDIQEQVAKNADCTIRPENQRVNCLPPPGLLVRRHKKKTLRTPKRKARGRAYDQSKVDNIGCVADWNLLTSREIVTTRFFLKFNALASLPTFFRPAKWQFEPILSLLL
jgi:hypothetical protein